MRKFGGNTRLNKFQLIKRFLIGGRYHDFERDISAKNLQPEFGDFNDCLKFLGKLHPSILLRHSALTMLNMSTVTKVLTLNNEVKSRSTTLIKKIRSDVDIRRADSSVNFNNIRGTSV